jgi:phosphoribosylanthranilate isomerase
MSDVAAKICGIRDADALEAALAGRAAYIGFVFYPPSPRAVTPALAAALSEQIGRRAVRVGLIVNATDIDIAAILAETPLDMLQLHGNETPERTAAVRGRFGLPVIKALPVAEPDDVAAASAYRAAADILLFDAKPPNRPDALPGGNAESFDWTLLADNPPDGPWMLSGGLTAANVGDAIKQSGANAVDVSSGVERSRGVKDPAMIKAFLASL